jgi:hypothetical protein
MRWRWPWCRDLNGSAEIRAKAEAKERATKRATPAYEQLASRMADLSDEEFVDRVARAFRRRPA